MRDEKQTMPLTYCNRGSAPERSVEKPSGSLLLNYSSLTVFIQISIFGICTNTKMHFITKTRLFKYIENFTIKN